MTNFKQKFSRSSVILGIILLIATILRTYNLTTVPPGFHRDEALFGYDAYSILKTGKDQHGRFLPLTFEGFGVWEYPLAFYLKIPFIAVLGLNVFSVRFSVVFISLITIFLIYKLTQKWFQNEAIALVAAFFGAISSWHIFMSRTGYSIGMYGLLMLLLGTYFLLFGNKLITKILGGFFLGLTCFSYASYFFFLPAYLLIIFFVYLKEIKKSKNFRVGLLCTSCVMILAFIIFWVPNLKRAPQAAFFYNDPGIRFAWSDKPVGETLAQGKKYDFFEKRLHDPRLANYYKVITNYFDAFSPSFWLKEGKGFESNVEGFGNLLIYEPFLIVLGCLSLIWARNRAGIFLIAWILAGPLSSVLTKEIASTRLLHMSAPFIILEAVGFIYLLKVLWSFGRILSLSFMLILFLGLTFVNSLYFDAYFRHMPYNAAKWWHAGYFDVVDLINKYPQKNVYWEGRGDFAYIFILFKNQYDPTRFQKESKRDLSALNLTGVISFDRYYFPEDIQWNKLCDDENAIYIKRPENSDDTSFVPDGQVSHRNAEKFNYYLTSKEKCR